MNKTKAQKYNEKLDKIFDPEINRLKRVEAISEEVLDKLDELVTIDLCGLDKCHLINAISRIIGKFIN
jgi:hypothetical protein